MLMGFQFNSFINIQKSLVSVFQTSGLTVADTHFGYTEIKLDKLESYDHAVKDAVQWWDRRR